jgi:hypothetical protein
MGLRVSALGTVFKNYWCSPSFPFRRPGQVTSPRCLSRQEVNWKEPHFLTVSPTASQLNPTLLRAPRLTPPLLQCNRALGRDSQLPATSTLWRLHPVLKGNMPNSEPMLSQAMFLILGSGMLLLGFQDASPNFTFPKVLWSFEPSTISFLYSFIRHSLIDIF